MTKAGPPKNKTWQKMRSQLLDKSLKMGRVDTMVRDYFPVFAQRSQKALAQATRGIISKVQYHSVETAYHGKASST